MPRDADRDVILSPGQAPELGLDFGDREEKQNVMVGQLTPPDREGGGLREKGVCQV